MGCPTTARSAQKLAKWYGAQSVSEFSADLSPEATVLDFGAGWSNLGQKVAEERPDISWVNVDMRYDSRRKAARVRRRAPSNLSFVAANIFRLEPGDLPPADRIFSSAMVTHFTLDSDELAAEAVHVMARQLKPEGRVAIADFVGTVATFSAQEYAVAPDLCTEAVVEAMKLDKATRACQIFTNAIYNSIQ